MSTSNTKGMVFFKLCICRIPTEEEEASGNHDDVLLVDIPGPVRLVCSRCETYEAFDVSDAIVGRMITFDDNPIKIEDGCLVIEGLLDKQDFPGEEFGTWRLYQ